MQPEYLTPAEIARELRVSVQTVNKWCRAGQLLASRAGRSWRVKRSDLDAFLRRNQPPLKERMSSASLAIAS